MLEILDLSSLGYYKIKQGILKQNSSKYNRFKKENTIHEHFNKHLNKFINTLKKEKEQGDGSKENYPWLDPTDERKYMTHREILKNIHRFKEAMPNRQRKGRGDGNVIQI